MSSINALDKIKEIENKAAEEIKALRQSAVTELVKKIAEAKETLAALEKQYSELTGRDFTGAKIVAKSKNASGYQDFTGSEELEKLLQVSGGTLNRKGFNSAGYSLKSAIQIAKADPKTFSFEQKGPQGSVSLN